MLISILMTARNAERYIDPCLQSIISQSETDWELCVVDNFSTDGTRLRLEYYSNLDKRIRLFSGTDGEIISALRVAYENSHGDILTRMDADDLMPMDRLSTMKSMLVEHGRGAVVTGAVKYISDEGLGNGFLRYESWLNTLMRNNNHYDDLYKECIIPSPCWMIYKADFESADAYRPNRYPEDYDLCFRFFREGYQILATTETMLFWRDYHNRNSRTDEKYKDNAFVALKWYWFNLLSRDNNRPLVIWGAGAKAKSLVKMIDGPLIWASNNPNKIGCNIYGHILVDSNSIDQIDNPQIIVAFSSPTDIARVEVLSKDSGWERNNDVFWFF